MANEQALAVQIQEVARKATMDQIIELASNPDFDAAKLHSLLDFQERLDLRNQKQAYEQAMVRASNAMPRISKDGAILNRQGQVQSRYATVENIDAQTRHILEENGLAVRYYSPDIVGKAMNIKAKVAHTGGFSEEFSMPVLLDDYQYRNGPQNSVSTFTYGKRVLYCSIFNIVMEGKDKDGATIETPISDQQAMDLETAISDTKSNLDAFKRHFGIAKVAELSTARYQEAMGMLNRKRSGK